MPKSRPIRRSRWGFAVADWELTRLARRGSPTISRILVGLILFAALLVTYLAAFPSDLDSTNPSRTQSRLAKFGQSFAFVFLIAQTVVALALTPLFVAGSIVEETERRTLEFLLATDLSPREVVLGKLWPRLLLVVGVILVGQPVLAVTQVWGGVDFQFVALSSIVVAFAIWATAGISSACAVGAKSLRQAMVRAYGWSFIALTFPILTCPCGMIRLLSEAHEAESAAAQARSAGATTASGYEIAIVGSLFGIQVLLLFAMGVLGLRRASRKLRDPNLLFARQVVRKEKPAHWERHPPVPDDSPLLWKEIHLSGQTARFVRMLNLVPWVVWLCVSSVFMIVGLAFALSQGNTSDVEGTVNSMVRWVGGLMVALMALTVGLHASGCVARERQQETLIDLLTIPRKRREIIWAKWLGSLAKARGIGVGMLAIPLVGVLAEGISFRAVGPLVLAAIAFVACSASFGLWVSVRSRTVQRATGVWLLIVGLWIGGTFLGAEAALVDRRAATRWQWDDGDAIAPLVWDRVLSPPMAWSQLAFRIRGKDEVLYDPYGRDRGRDGLLRDPITAWPSLLGVGLYLTLAAAFYWAAARRFELEA